MPDTAYACNSDKDCSHASGEKCATGIYGRQCMDADTANYYQKQIDKVTKHVSKNKTRKDWSLNNGRKKPALAFCWQNSAQLWFCDGKTKKTSTGHKDLDKALSLVGCMRIKKVLHWPQNGDVGRIFMCKETISLKGDTGKLTLNRDIRKWRTTPIGW